MAPDDRRRSIIDAVTPLLIEQGASVTTKQMAEAACVAEGTIFRVFPDKCALMGEVVRASVDPEPFLRAIDAIDPAAPFETQLRMAAEALQQRVERIVALMPVWRALEGPHATHPGGPPAFLAESHAAVTSAITEVLARHRDRLRLSPERAMGVFRGLIFASSLPSTPEPERPTLDEVVDTMLHGLTTPDVVAVGES
jgi:AcrR family transcriptional regulator